MLLPAAAVVESQNLRELLTPPKDPVSGHTSMDAIALASLLKARRVTCG
jgi:hypothetical protein